DLNGQLVGCANPEPYAYEEDFGVQRLIVAQIKETNNITSPDTNAGQVDYSVAPWFDWGPYIWARPDLTSNNGLVWCNANTPPASCRYELDFRYGDPTDDNPSHNWYGDFTHPTYQGLEKVADMYRKWFQNQIVAPSPQQNIYQWVSPWILTNN